MFPKAALLAAITAALVVNATPALELKFSGQHLFTRYNQ
jgi:hypothetical protein